MRLARERSMLVEALLECFSVSFWFIDGVCDDADGRVVVAPDRCGCVSLEEEALVD